MARIIILVAVITIGLLLWYKIKSAKPEDRKKMTINAVIGVIVGTLLLAAATGKLHVLAALIGSAVAFIPKVAGAAMRYLPFLTRLYTSTKQQQQGQPGPQKNQQTASRSPGGMTRDEALKILGLKPDASKEEILAAHKRMMQKMHPDRGGSDHLASQINQAKDTLLG